MPKPRKSKVIRCRHFTWRSVNRSGTWRADGRSNSPNAGRHSLGTKDKEEALSLLPELDRVRAEDLGLVPRSAPSETSAKPLSLEDGRKHYEAHIARPRVTGGVRRSTQKRYRAVLDKFIPFAVSQEVSMWSGVTAQLLNKYAAYLEGRGYAHKTVHNELTTLKQAFKWLVSAGHLRGLEPIELPLRKAESVPAYCYRAEEVQAMVKHTSAESKLEWLHDIIVTLACTGLRIAELASLRSSDVDLGNGRLHLTDETGRSAKLNRTRRELKSGRSRSFPIHSKLLVVLRRIGHRNGHLFRGPRHGRLKPDTVRRIFIREVIDPLSEQFPSVEGVQGFKDGRLHSFRHYFCSTCANNGIPERMVMDWLGHADSEMIRHYYHLHDEEAQRRMNSLDFLGAAGGRSARDAEVRNEEEGVEPLTTERSDEGDDPD